MPAVAPSKEPAVNEQQHDCPDESIAAAGEEVSEDTTNHRGKGNRAPSVLSNVFIGCLANVLGSFGCELLPVLKFFGHFSCIHDSIIVRSYTLPNGAGTPDNESTKTKLQNPNNRQDP